MSDEQTSEIFDLTRDHKPWYGPSESKEFLNCVFMLMVDLMGNTPLCRFEYSDEQAVEHCREIVKNAVLRITTEHGASSWKWVSLVQGLRDLSVLIKRGWRNATAEKGNIFTREETTFFYRSVDKLDKLYSTVEAHIICDPIIHDFHSQCIQDSSVISIIRPRPLTLDEGDDDKEPEEPQAKRVREDNSEVEGVPADDEEPPESQDPNAEVPELSKSEECPAPPKKQPIAHVREWTVIDEDNTHTTFTFSFSPEI